eukprot:TRINITY_DN40665_c0_g1_i1.p1 TRINITY_DN40665_c0_g1~~TRINITY_DN40665_c0_g1_i1.p1  ORF type:complete len:189 (-),score=14.36 TRINITY_DN40665_c0_g1_i1:893-1402(-)
MHASVALNATTEEARQSVQQVNCNTPAEQAPSSGLVHLENCDIVLPPTAMDAIFEGFEDVVPPEARHKYAWSRLRIHHGRVRSSWSDIEPEHKFPGQSESHHNRIWVTVPQDGDLVEQWRSSKGSQVGPYTVNPFWIPGKQLKLQPRPGQKPTSSRPSQSSTRALETGS